MDVAQFVFGNVGGVVVPPGFAGAVTCEVLGAGRDGPGRGPVFTLQTPDHGGGEPARQVGILAEALGDTAPPGIARNVDHGRQGPVHTGPRRFQRRVSRTPLDELRVPGRGLSQGNGQHRPESVNHIPGQQQRDSETAFLHGDPLQLVRHVHIDHVEQRADLPGSDGAAQVRRDFARVMGLDHLADLLTDRHAAHEIHDPRLHRIVRQRRLLGHHGRISVHTEQSPEEVERGPGARGIRQPAAKVIFPACHRCFSDQADGTAALNPALKVISPACHRRSRGARPPMRGAPAWA